MQIFTDSHASCILHNTLQSVTMPAVQRHPHLSLGQQAHALPKGQCCKYELLLQAYLHIRWEMQSAASSCM